MRNVKLLLVLALAFTACIAYAQDDDWQIAGGPGTAFRNAGGRQADFGYSSRTVSLWNGGYQKAPFAFVMGYVSKQWISQYESGTRRENFFGCKNQRFHGMQIGLQANPSYDFGLGLRTGIFYELYLASGADVQEQGWDKFSEHDLYIPLHVSLRLPFSAKSDLTLFGGAGFQWAIAGEYRDRGYSEYDYYGDYHYYGPRGSQRYGGGWPRHVNWQIEGGANLRINPIVLSFTYSYGLTNHMLQSNELGDAIRSRQDKLAFSLGFVF